MEEHIISLTEYCRDICEKHNAVQLAKDYRKFAEKTERLIYDHYVGVRVYDHYIALFPYDSREREYDKYLLFTVDLIDGNLRGFKLGEACY